MVPRNVRLAEAPSHGQPINIYDRESRGAIAYLGLAGEMIRRLGLAGGKTPPSQPAPESPAAPAAPTPGQPRTPIMKVSA